MNPTRSVWQVQWQPLHTNDHMAGTWWEDSATAEYIANSLRDSRHVRNVTVERLKVREDIFQKVASS